MDVPGGTPEWIDQNHQCRLDHDSRAGDNAKLPGDIGGGGETIGYYTADCGKWNKVQARWAGITSRDLFREKFNLKQMGLAERFREYLNLLIVTLERKGSIGMRLL